MVAENKGEEQVSLFRISGVCKRIRVFIKVAFVVFCICWIVAAVFIALSMSDVFTGESILKITLHLARGAVIAVIFIILIGIFSDAANGRSPFTFEQVKRLRTMAFTLLIYAILEVIFSTTSVVMQLGNVNSGYFSTNGSGIITVDFAPFIAAAVIFAFSYVFKYGVLLQEFSDETL